MESANSSDSKKILPDGVKEYTQKPSIFKPRTALRLIQSRGGSLSFEVQKFLESLIEEKSKEGGNDTR